MFDNSGEITPPCGVPATVSRNTPSSITPASSHKRTSLQHPPIRDPLGDQRQQLLLIDLPK